MIHFSALSAALHRLLRQAKPPVPILLKLSRSLRALLPSCCALCGQASLDAVCLPCREAYFGQPQTRCRICAMPLPNEIATHARELPCGICLQDPPDFDTTIVATDYVPPVDLLVQALKFSAKLPLAPMFASLLRDALAKHVSPLAAGTPRLPDLLTCVPLSRARLQQRGYNQTLEIVRPLARLTGIALEPQLLVRRRDTLAQSGLTPAERHRNISGAFDMHDRFSDPDDRTVAGRHIGVVDDVITTGRTLHEIAKVLKGHGAVHVTNLVFARTLR